jgi:predicted CoA-binding protein
LKTLVIGASTNPDRYSYLAIKRLVQYGHETIGLGLKTGEVDGVQILTGQPPLKDIDTITIYMNSRNQAPLTDYLLELKPRRLIFNPGAENPEFESKAMRQGIQVLQACTLVLLSTGQY